MKRKVARFISSMILLLMPVTTSLCWAATYDLQFAGTVDGMGYFIGGVPAPVGSPFTLNLTLDDATATPGEYEITAVSFSLTTGTYTTVTDWTTVGMFTAAVNGPTLDLATNPLFQDPDEHVLVNVSGVNGVTTDPTSWNTGNTIMGDVIVRGIGGFASNNQLSAAFPYTGTLSLSVVPEPSAIGLALLGTACFACRRIKK